MHAASGDRKALVGRANEFDALVAEYTHSCAGAARVALVRGHAGMGKTALLERFAEHANDASIVRGAGVESEMDVEFGVVEQLLRQVSTSVAEKLGGDHLRAGR